MVAAVWRLKCGQFSYFHFLLKKRRRRNLIGFEFDGEEVEIIITNHTIHTHFVLALSQMDKTFLITPALISVKVLSRPGHVKSSLLVPELRQVDS